MKELEYHHFAAYNEIDLGNDQQLLKPISENPNPQIIKIGRK